MNTPGRWRAVNKPHLVTLARSAAIFVNGILIERADEDAPPAAAAGHGSRRGDRRAADGAGTRHRRLGLGFIVLAAFVVILLCGLARNSAAVRLLVRLLVFAGVVV
jgi:hypothetical protein